ncbi:Thioesterase/thiol ester dehydrase-isomerase [Teratosphaeria nubilosa]|uniref:Thioesterase/thiol ester dehydrase-isomerase n=1 Tax=Teratosphaeria nubilosa TaxID=161662 RepID=A0A6G1LIY4_9PEZI|nr:Thioesterase/thiol ester dehydrase-isomerase [Teratosphaeria nubilosa]
MTLPAQMTRISDRGNESGRCKQACTYCHHEGAMSVPQHSAQRHCVPQMAEKWPTKAKDRRSLVHEVGRRDSSEVPEFSIGSRGQASKYYVDIATCFRLPTAHYAAQQFGRHGRLSTSRYLHLRAQSLKAYIYPLPTMTHYDGNISLPFVDLIKLEKIDERTYRSTAQPFSPGGPIGLGRGYGGHCLMQSAWAACQTVASGFLLHHVSCNFILPGLPMLPFVYKVHIIRDGRSYATRIVNVTQQNGKGICLTCTCSFKTAEISSMDVQDHVDIPKKIRACVGRQKTTRLRRMPWHRCALVLEETESDRGQ